MTPAAWSAFIAAAGVCVSMWAQILAWRRDIFSRGISSISRLDERFESPEFRENRRRAAVYLHNRTAGAVTDFEGEEAVLKVLGFFETLGFLFRKKVVDVDSAWHFFASWLLPYYVAAQPIVCSRRADDPNVFCDVEALYTAVRKYEEKRHPSGDTLHITGPDSVRAFLEREGSLPGLAPPSSAPA